MNKNVTILGVVALLVAALLATGTLSFQSFVAPNGQTKNTLAITAVNYDTCNWDSIPGAMVYVFGPDHPVDGNTFSQFSDAQLSSMATLSGPTNSEGTLIYSLIPADKSGKPYYTPFDYTVGVKAVGYTCNVNLISYNQLLSSTQTEPAKTSVTCRKNDISDLLSSSQNPSSLFAIKDNKLVELKCNSNGVPGNTTPNPVPPTNSTVTSVTQCLNDPINCVMENKLALILGVVGAIAVIIGVRGG